jgi:glycosyltransferase involved in cell wall biosynthesis
MTTVVIPVHNGARYIGEAVDSIRRQGWGSTEIVVVDDGSTDATPEVVRGLANVVYLRQDHAGPAAALNRGAGAAAGRFIAFLSADDVWQPDKLERQHMALGSDPEGKLVFGHMQHFISPEIEPAVAGTLRCPAEAMPAYSAGTLLATRDTFHSVGPFDESFKVGEFLDWFGRARDLGMEIVMLSDFVSMRRVHESNHSTSALKKQTYAPVLKALLNRRRSTGRAP